MGLGLDMTLFTLSGESGMSSSARSMAFSTFGSPSRRVRLRNLSRSSVSSEMFSRLSPFSTCGHARGTQSQQCAEGRCTVSARCVGGALCAGSARFRHREGERHRVVRPPLSLARLPLGPPARHPRHLSPRAIPIPSRRLLSPEEGRQPVRHSNVPMIGLASTARSCRYVCHPAAHG